MLIGDGDGCGEAAREWCPPGVLLGGGACVASRTRCKGCLRVSRLAGSAAGLPGSSMKADASKVCAAAATTGSDLQQWQTEHLL